MSLGEYYKVAVELPPKLGVGWIEQVAIRFGYMCKNDFVSNIDKLILWYYNKRKLIPRYYTGGTP